MPTLNALDPTPEQIKEFLSHSKAGEPVYMLNLLKFKEKATYKDGEDISGREAYQRYAEGFARINGDKTKTIFGGAANAFLIGEGQGNGTPSQLSNMTMPRPCLTLSARTNTAKSTNTAAPVWKVNF